MDYLLSFLCTNMDQFLSCLCMCVKEVMEYDKDGDGIPDFMQEGSRKTGDSLNDALLRNLLSIRGRKNNIRNIPIEIVPTKFEDEDEIPEEDEDGNETSVFQGGFFAGQDYEHIKSKCLETEQLFVDPMFPPCESSLYTTKSSSGITWIRASELVSDPQFFVGGASRFDIKQGELGDCWLLAAIANLTLHEKLFNKVVPHDQSFENEYAGIFHFRIWQYGEWIDVVIDDYLPTRNGKLMFMSSDDSNEFWSAMLEKAYAKLHGSYEALRGGTTSEALVDFSGGCAEHYDLKEEDSKEIYDLMMKAYEKSSMMACSMEPDPRRTEAKTSVGLIRGHAYSITKVCKAKIDTGFRKKEYPLVRIRNPWGNEAEWNGAWSDGSEEWNFVPAEEKTAQGIVFEDDGEFFMSIEDFIKYFDTLEICNLTPDSLDESESTYAWHEEHFTGSWVEGESAGGCRNFLETFASNPQFVIHLVDSDDDDDELCTLVVALMQKGSRKKKAITSEGCLSIGFAIYQLDDPEANLPLDTDFFKYHASCARSKTFINLREVVNRFKLHPGTYVIIPSTFQQNQEGDFLIRVFSEKGSGLEAV